MIGTEALPLSSGEHGPAREPERLDLDARRQAGRRFVGRQDELAQVLLELDTPVDVGGAIVVSISGVGGVGKTMLLRQILGMRRSLSMHVFADDRDGLTDSATVARLLAGRLAKCIGSLSHCAQAVLAGGDVARLTDAFIRDVNLAGSTGQQVVLAIDGYEAVREVLAPWLLDELLGERLTPITGDLRLIVSGREPLQRTHLRWLMEWGAQIKNVELEPFTLAETEQFLQSQRYAATPVTSSQEVEAAHRLTGGLPVWLALWSPRNTSGGPSAELASADNVQAVVDRFLMWWGDPAHLRWVRATWVPRWFNQEVLAVLLGEEAVPAFEWLTRQAAITFSEHGRWRYHEVVRTALRHEALKRTPETLGADHDRLADYWHSRDSAEAVYHRLLGTDPQTGVALTCERYVQALMANVGEAAIVAAALDARAECVAPTDLRALDVVRAHWLAHQAGDRNAERQARDRLLNLGLLSAAGRAVLLAQVVEEDRSTLATREPPRPQARHRWSWLWFRRRRPQPTIERSSRMAALVEYGDSLRAAGNYAAAISTLDEILEIDPDHPQARLGRGEALRAMGRSAEAIRDLTAAVRLAPDNVWAWTLRSAAYLSTDAFDKAYADADRALGLDPGSAWALTLRGLACCQINQYPTPAACADLRRALQIAPDLTWARSALDEWQTLLAAGFLPIEDADEA